MKKLLNVTYFLLITILFSQCSNEYQLPDNLVIKDFVWKGLNAYYLYQDEIADLSDRRFSSDLELNTYLSSFSDYNSLFNSLLIPLDVKSSLSEDYNNLDFSAPRNGFINGLEFGVFKEQDSDTVIAYALEVLPLSYATTQTISRGDYFYAVVNQENDTIYLLEENYEDVLINYGQDTLQLVKSNYDGLNLTKSTQTVKLVKENYTYPKVNLEKVFSIGAKNIGYLMYHNDFSENSINSLNETFLSFKNRAISELVLDLRYNIGGGSNTKSVANLASMITGQFSNEVFIKEQWNSKAQTWFESNQPDSLVTRFPIRLNTNTPFNSLNLTAVYIVLNGNNYTSSSAIELLINSLKPYITVHIIGENTVGNNTGTITLFNSNDYNFPLKNEIHTVALQPIVLNFLNKNDQTYDAGFIPDILLCSNENVLELGVLGERTDPLLNRVLEYVTSGNTGINTMCNPNEYIFLYHSINNQRLPDNGVFLEQNLPNTN
jgi:carboxyl-terminal processing protease